MASKGKSSLSTLVFERICDARFSKVRYAHIDLFVGPFTGRHSMKTNLERVCKDIGEPHRFRCDQAVLVVESDVKFPKGLLVVIGGGHRLLAAAHMMQIKLLPYQVVDLSSITEFGRPISVVTHGAVMWHHLEATESRPEPFTVMQQVESFGRLQEYWQWRESEKMLASGKRRRRMPAMTQQKLLDAYEELKEDTEESSRYAIEFLSPKELKPKPESAKNTKKNVTPTIQGYISGAQRLLRAGVVPYLCELESDGIAVFNRRTLHIVKNWSPEKIKDRVELWKSRSHEGMDCDYKFTDSTGSEVDGKGRGRKKSGKKATLTLLKGPPPGWESYIDWTQPGTAARVNDLEGRVNEEAEEEDGEDAEEIVLKKEKFEVMKIVRDRVKEVMKKGGTKKTFDLGEIVEIAIAQYKKNRAKEIAVKVKGGVSGNRFELFQEDHKRITTFNMASDSAVMFTLQYLSNWHTDCLPDVYLMDSLMLEGWFGTVLHEGKEPLETLKRRTKSVAGRTLLWHQRTWFSRTTLLPMVGANHWTLAVVVNFPSVLQEMEQVRRTKAPPTEKKAAVFWIDSMEKGSPQEGMRDNIFHYLVAAYPGTRKLTVTQLKERVSFYPVKKDVQNGLECGFYVAYHVSIVSKNHRLFLEGDYAAVQLYMTAMYKSYTFKGYRKDVQTRLQSLKEMYERNGERYVESSPFYWTGRDPKCVSIRKRPELVLNTASGPVAEQSKNFTEVPVPRKEATTTSKCEEGSRTRVGDTKGSKEKEKKEGENEDEDFMERPPKRSKLNQSSELWMAGRDAKAEWDGDQLRRAEGEPCPFPTEANQSVPDGREEPQVPGETGSVVPDERTEPTLSADARTGKHPSDLKEHAVWSEEPEGSARSNPQGESYGPLPQALTGVLHGLLAMDGNGSPETKKKVISKVMRDSKIVDKMQTLGQECSIDKGMGIMTPVVISKYREVVGSTRAGIDGEDLCRTRETIGVQQGVRSPSSPGIEANDRHLSSTECSKKGGYAAMMEEAQSLLEVVSDTAIKKEWKTCMAKVEELVRKMKSPKSK